MTPVQKARVQVYLTPRCPFCIMAKEVLDGLGVDFEEIDLSGERDRRAFTSAILPGHTTVPLILIDGQPIGGHSELTALYRSGALQEKLFED